MRTNPPRPKLMPEQHARKQRARGRGVLLALLALLLVIGYWRLPLSGKVVILTGEAELLTAWPQIWTEPAATQPGETITLYMRDNTPWYEPKAMVNGVAATRDYDYPAGTGPWEWRWTFAAPERAPYEIVFYHSCHANCTERGRVTIGPLSTVVTPTPAGRTTKLGVVFPDPTRDWHGRGGWGVELTYTQLEQDPSWTFDMLAQHVHEAQARGLRVLVRIAYDRGQSMPPTDDEKALAAYLDYCARLAHDERLRGVYAYIVGSGYNSAGENQSSKERPTSPEWYARVFNGYGTDTSRIDNVVQTMRAINPHARILVGPVTPWKADQDGAVPDPLNQPWLNYLNTTVSLIDSAARERHGAGIPIASADGFAVQAPGRPEAPEVAADPAQEPLTDLHRPEWGQAQAGFRIYRDWKAIVNRYTTTQGLPLYITSTNTFTADTNIPPVQNYPRGWLTSALREISQDPQVQALCWFVDSERGTWHDFSLTVHPGRLNEAAAEFDQLLRQ